MLPLSSPPLLAIDGPAIGAVTLRSLPSGRQGQHQRISLALLAAVCLHAGCLVLLVVTIHGVTPPEPEPITELTMEFAPAPALPAATPAPAAPETDTQATPPPVPPLPPPPPVVTPPPEPIPPPPPPEPPRPEPLSPTPPSPVAAPPKPRVRAVPAPARPPPRAPIAPAQLAEPTPAAPSAPSAEHTASPPAPVDPNAVATWRSALADWLESHKSYPSAARRNGDEGRVVVHFDIDHDGNVRDVTLIKSSGSTSLDDAAVAMLRGARLPSPPASMAAKVGMTVPIIYRLTN